MPKCEHGLTSKECYVCASPKHGAKPERHFCERCGKRLSQDGIHTCTPPQQAEPVEPVAWMDPASGDVISDARHEAWERDFGLAGKGKAALFTVPLYTTPPQRKPLPTHDQHCVDVPGYGLMAVRLVRAVERAHGIPMPDEP